MTTFDEVPTNDYFESYDNISVHNLMLRDGPRVTKYREAIFASKQLIKDKIVLDVGCGTAILSLFCAQAGARHVYAVEACKGIYELAKSIVKANRLDDKITLIHSEIEKIDELPVKHVDVIVSEWMGFYLLHESMLASVIYARDRWLDEKGIMLPSMAYLYVSPIEMTEYLDKTLGNWKRFEGLDYSPMGKVYSQMLLEKPLVETISHGQLIDEEKMLASFDLRHCTLEDLRSIQSYNIEFTSNRDGAKLHGFVFWFDVVFRCDNDECVYLSTSPSNEPTHWKQTITFLPQAISEYVNDGRANSESKLELKSGDSFECYVLMNQGEENSRSYEIDIGVDLNPGKEDVNAEQENREEIEEEDDQDYDDDDEDDDDDDDYDEKLHPIPCDCGNIKCVLIKATLQKYESEAK